MTHTCTRLLMAFLLLLAVAAAGNAAITELDSSGFDWSYEMDILPDAEDLDENGTFDFTFSNSSAGTVSVADGIMTLNSTATGSCYFYAGAADTIWPGKFTAAGGYTIEARVKAVSDANWRGPFAMVASPDGTADHSYFNIQSSGQSWGEQPPAGGLGSNDNMDDYHDFRITAMNEGGVFHVWRDGVLVGENLVSPSSFNLDRFLFGDTGGGNAGECMVDYLRFTSGNFAPVGGEQPVPLNRPERPGAVAGGPVIDDGTTPYAWYRADEGVVTYPDGATRVAWWSDQSGNDRHLEAFAEPNLTSDGIEGRAVVSFDDVRGDRLQATVADWGEAEAGTVFAVWSRVDTSYSGATFVYDSAADGPQQFLSLRDKRDPVDVETGGSTVDGEDWWTHYTSDSVLNDPVGEGNWGVTSVSHTTGLTDTVRINGEEVYVGDLLSEGMHGLTLGANREGLNSWTGYIAEVIVFEGELSAAEREAIEQTLIDRWGVITEPIPGDANLDGIVNAADAAVLAGNWQTLTGATWGMGDFNNDGAVDDIDATLLSTNWQVGASSQASVPEPGTLTLLAGTLLLVLLRRRVC